MGDAAGALGPAFVCLGMASGGGGAALPSRRYSRPPRRPLQLLGAPGRLRLQKGHHTDCLRALLQQAQQQTDAPSHGPA
eukprot:scaffold221_cov249-Pinguiococcus_pyrenoidosus.AAC.4